MRLIDADALMPNAEYKGRYDVVTAYDIANAPTIEPEPQWIPCSKRMPDTNGVYNVTRKISDGFVCRNISDTCYYDGSNTWHDDTRVNHERRYITDVIAWMPLPEPWKGETK